MVAKQEAQEQGSDIRLLIAVLAVLVVVVVVFVYALEAVRGPETFTQTWLEPGNPELANSGERSTIRFTIDSHEAGPTEYSYAILAEDSTKASGSVSLSAGESKTVEESIAITSTGSQRVDIEITKPGRAEPYTLWFWVEVS